MTGTDCMHETQYYIMHICLLLIIEIIVILFNLCSSMADLYTVIEYMYIVILSCKQI